ncbi:MAG: hypothetical protein ACO1SX_13045 [Actinomycetota bacterium]
MSATATSHEIPSGYTAVTTPAGYGYLSLVTTPFGEFEGWGATADAALASALRKARREDGS